MTSINFKDEIATDIKEQYNVHDHLKGLPVNALKEVCKEEQLPFAVCAVSITGDLNIGTIIRTSSLFGAEKVIVVGRTKFDRRGLVGSMNYIDVEFAGGQLNNSLEINPEAFVSTMKNNKYIPIFLEQGGININNFQWETVKNYIRIEDKDNKLCLVIGNENRGIPDDILDTRKEFPGSAIVSISQRGVIRSHNVSVATGIALSHMTEVYV